MAKIRQSIAKRFKFTKTGKILRMAVGLNHNRAKKTGDARRKGHKMIQVSKSEAKKIRQLLKY